jgi:hypothetical protein
MKFDISIWWHWLFILAAMSGSAYHACRVFFDAYAQSHSPLFPPFLQFFYELAGSFAGWMALWYVLPFSFTCTGANCTFTPSVRGLLIVGFAALGVFGKIPESINHLAGALGFLDRARQ